MKKHKTIPIFLIIFLASLAQAADKNKERDAIATQLCQYPSLVMEKQSPEYVDSYLTAEKQNLFSRFETIDMNAPLSALAPYAATVRADNYFGYFDISEIAVNATFLPERKAAGWLKDAFLVADKGCKTVDSIAPVCKWVTTYQADPVGFLKELRRQTKELQGSTHGKDMSRLDVEYAAFGNSLSVRSNEENKLTYEPSHFSVLNMQMSKTLGRKTKVTKDCMAALAPGAPLPNSSSGSPAASADGAGASVGAAPAAIPATPGN